MSERFKWHSQDDIPEGIRNAMRQYVLLREADPASLERLQNAIIQGVQKALRNERIRWACRSLINQFPRLDKRDVFHAVGLEFCLSADMVRKVYHSEATVTKEAS